MDRGSSARFLQQTCTRPDCTHVIIVLKQFAACGTRSRLWRSLVSRRFFSFEGAHLPGDDLCRNSYNPNRLGKPMTHAMHSNVDVFTGSKFPLFSRRDYTAVDCSACWSKGRGHEDDFCMRTVDNLYQLYASPTSWGAGLSTTWREYFSLCRS